MPRRPLEQGEHLSGVDAIQIRRAIVQKLRQLQDRRESFLCDSLSLSVYQLDDKSWTVDAVLEADPNHTHRVTGDHEAVQSLLRLNNRAVDALVSHFTGN